MSKFDIRQRWSNVGSGAPELSHTLAEFEIHIGDYNLTRNENIWSQTIQDYVLVSTYPLSVWILQNWWRLLYEPLSHEKPDISWRMAHELGAANNGFVWPKIVFASDSENVMAWASASGINCQQSVKYINGLNAPVSIPIPEFRSILLEFVSTVESRLDVFQLKSSELSELFNIIKDEEKDENSRIYRKLEALMGFDPDECSTEVMEYAIHFCNKYGERALLELAPVYGKGQYKEPLKPLEAFIGSPGICGKPAFSRGDVGCSVKTGELPWKLAVDSARKLRGEIGNNKNPIDTNMLFDLLGVAKSDSGKWEPIGRSRASVGIPVDDHRIKFVPRKKHPISKRFELSRYVADFIYTGADQWLTNTDLGTARQKYQRAFAAEFLCPINSLVEFLDEDFSEEAIEDAENHFEVSKQTITSLLINNRIIEHHFTNEPPYQIGFNY